MKKYSEKGKAAAYFTNPLYFLRSDGFWNLKKKNGEDFKESINNSPGLKQTYALLDYAYFDTEVYSFFNDTPKRNDIRACLIETYFAHHHTQTTIVKESLPEYGEKWTAATVWQGYKRNSFFRDNIMFLYKDACAFTKMKNGKAPIIQACHIIPHHFSGDNSVDNGIALCANLHLAFDYGEISIGDEYELLVKNKAPLSKSNYDLSKLKGTKLNLPHEATFYPSLDKNRAHRKQWSF